MAKKRPDPFFKDMRICLLTNQDLLDPGLAEYDWPCDPRPYVPEANWTVAVLEKDSAVETVVKLYQKGFDVFFNLCDGSWFEAENPGVEVVHALERLQVPFTGATSAFFEPSREAQKRICTDCCIRTPAYAVVRNGHDINRAAKTLNFPLFVKHPESYASVGITRESKVDDVGAFRKQAQRMIKAYGSALVEEYIAGSECTVLVAENPDDPDEPITYPPVRFSFPDGDTFKHEDLKWVSYEGLESALIKDEALDDELRELASRFFLALNGASFGRCDLRIDKKGRPWMLEMNSNCGIYYPEADAASADFVLLNDEDGHEGFTKLLIESALARHERSLPNWEVKTDDFNEFGVFARRSIQPDEEILRWEDHPHRLVTLSHVEENWSKRRLDDFRRTAWPLTDEIWVARHPDAEQWTPIRHSCSPNAWLDGLNVVARRSISKGREITIDYATLYNERMPSFECKCSARNCRGTIRGTDYLEPFVDRYGDHVSEYVRERRSARDWSKS